MGRQENAGSVQLGFDALLTQAETDNRAREDAKAYGDLPATMHAALPFYRALLARHNQSMLAGDAAAVSVLRQEAHDLAYKLNDYQPGILANDDAPGCVLDRLTRACDGEVPIWGQSGSFVVACEGMQAQIELDGLFGVGACHMAWLSFAANAVEPSKPFLSETGYRSFMGVGGELRAGYSPDAFATSIIAAYVASQLKGKLKKIGSPTR